MFGYGIRLLAPLALAFAALSTAGGARAEAARLLTLSTDGQTPDVGDGVRLETDVLTRPPYNQGGYEVWLWFCPGPADRCRDRRNWRRMPATNAQGDAVRPPMAFVCRSGHCSQRVRPSRPREVDYFFLAALHHGGQFVARSNAVRVSWRNAPKREQEKPRSAAITLTITAGGKTCTAVLGDNGASPSPRYASPLIDRCLVEPNGLVLRIAPDGSAPGFEVTVRFTGLEEPQYSAVLLHAGQFHPCPGNPCSVKFPAKNPGTFGGGVNHASAGLVGALLHYDHTKGARARTPEGKAFDGLQAEISVDYRR